MVEDSAGKKKVIVTGGKISGDSVESTLLLDLDNPIEWTTGIDLPQALNRGGSVQFKNTFLVVGGSRDEVDYKYFSDFIYEYEVETGEWITRTERLQSERDNPAAFLVPDYVATCN